nr:Peptidase S10 domain containing protein [Haemonchus contortus]
MFLAKLICPFAFCQAKEIKQLPGVGFELNFKHYSGFFQVSDTHLLHYWFVESQNEPYKDPLIFWFNGGPGCSSLEGLLKDMGPYSVNFDGKSLRENPYSWNKGIALGNGWVHEKLNIDTSIRYAYGHGIVDEKTWNTVQKDCCKGCIDTCDLTQAEESKNHFLCENNTNIVKYVNDAEVRKALNIPSNLPKWDICSTQVTNAYKRQYGDMTPFIKKIVAASVRVLLFYGDTDMACNFMMGQKFVDQLGLKQTLGRAPWRFDRQIAGFKTVFEGLTFITVRGAGHKAARQKAPQMYYAIQQFLLNHPI